MFALSAPCPAFPSKWNLSLTGIWQTDFPVFRKSLTVQLLCSLETLIAGECKHSRKKLGPNLGPMS
jgi:hypothetical protein